MYVFFFSLLILLRGRGQGGGLSCYLSIFFFSFFSKGERDAGGGGRYGWLQSRCSYLENIYILSS